MKRALIAVAVVLSAVVVLALLGSLVPETDEERAARAAEKAEERRKGFHCLSKWDGAHSELEYAIRQRMRDPDSFEHIETLITPVSPQGTHSLIMRFRARNGFGGMSIGEVTAEVETEGCGYTVLTIDDGA